MKLDQKLIEKLKARNEVGKNRGPKLTVEQREEVVVAYANGERVPSICARFGITPAAVYQRVRKYIKTEGGA